MRQIPERPLAQFDLSTPEGRKRARRDYMWNDHAFLRLRFQNAHWISEELVRTNQPSPEQLAGWKARGIKTIINLRGGFDGSFYVLEKEACAQLGLKLVDFTITSREVPSRARVLGARDLFQSIEYPALMHCKSGADRAGLMSALYMIFRRKMPVAKAAEQLSGRFLHVKSGKTGMLDAFFQAYADYNAGRAPEDWKPFLDWVSDDYDRLEVKKNFLRDFGKGIQVDKILQRE